jgi:two-component system cell cycle sensor histidine kinase/response regulator CckA
MPQLHRGREVSVGGPGSTGVGQATPLFLVVDEDPLLRNGMKRVVLDEGFLVVTAASGVEAMDLVADGLAPDAVLSDLSMPGMDGVTLASRLHARFPDLPFVFMSGSTDAAELARVARDAGGTVLEKPFDLGVLARSVRDAVAHGSIHSPR